MELSLSGPRSKSLNALSRTVIEMAKHLHMMTSAEVNSYERTPYFVALRANSGFLTAQEAPTRRSDSHACCAVTSAEYRPHHIRVGIVAGRYPRAFARLSLAGAGGGLLASENPEISAKKQRNKGFFIRIHLGRKSLSESVSPFR